MEHDGRGTSVTRVSSLALGLAIFLAACGGASQSASQSPDASDAARGGGPSTLDQVREEGVLRVGVRQDFPPLGILDENGELVGFEVDLAKYIAEKLGVELELTAVTADTRIPLLTDGRVDLILAGMGHYRERDEVIDFTLGYLPTIVKAMVPADSGYTTLDDLEGKRVSTAQGAGGLESFAARVQGADVQAFRTYEDAFLALEQGAVDAMIGQSFRLAGVRNRSANPEGYIFIREQWEKTGDQAGGVRENDSEWLDFVNFTILEWVETGLWDEAFGVWYGPDTDFATTKEELEEEFNWQMVSWW